MTGLPKNANCCVKSSLTQNCRKAILGAQRAAVSRAFMDEGESILIQSLAFALHFIVFQKTSLWYCFIFLGDREWIGENYYLSSEQGLRFGGFIVPLNRILMRLIKRH